jgi:hypothetical protein
VAIYFWMLSTAVLLVCFVFSITRNDRLKERLKKEEDNSYRLKYELNGRRQDNWFAFLEVLNAVVKAINKDYGYEIVHVLNSPSGEQLAYVRYNKWTIATFSMEVDTWHILLYGGPDLKDSSQIKNNRFPNGLISSPATSWKNLDELQIEIEHQLRLLLDKPQAKAVAETVS